MACVSVFSNEVTDSQRTSYSGSSEGACQEYYTYSQALLEYFEYVLGIIYILYRDKLLYKFTLSNAIRLFQRVVGWVHK